MSFRSAFAESVKQYGTETPGALNTPISNIYSIVTQTTTVSGSNGAVNVLSLYESLLS